MRVILGENHEAGSGPIIGHPVSAFLWGKNMKLRGVLLPETLNFPKDWPWKIANIETILSPHPSLQHLPQIELGSERALARRKHPWDGGGRSRNDDNA